MIANHIKVCTQYKYIIRLKYILISINFPQGNCGGITSLKQNHHFLLYNYIMEVIVITCSNFDVSYCKKTFITKFFVGKRAKLSSHFRRWVLFKWVCNFFDLHLQISINQTIYLKSTFLSIFFVLFFVTLFVQSD